VATNGDSGVKQSFTVVSNQNLLSFYYKMSCPDLGKFLIVILSFYNLLQELSKIFAVVFDWVTATLEDHTVGTTWAFRHTCETSADWTLVTTSVIAGHAYTLSLTNHDDNNIGDPSYTDFDNIFLSPITPLSCIGFNSQYLYKYDFNNPSISNSDFYVHEVS
jgi:hypothetical protein